MKKLLLIIVMLFAMTVPSYASAIEAPQAPSQVQDIMPTDQSDFGQALWSILSDAFAALSPDLANSAGVCAGVIAAVIMIGMLKDFAGLSKNTAELTGTLIISCILLANTNALIGLASDTVTQISEYGKNLLPVMTSAMAAQGGLTGSAALYTATAVFDAVLVGLISALLVPMVYAMLLLSISGSAIGQQTLHKLRDLTKWFMSWCLKTILYVFTGYIGVTGVISGTTDQSMLKATKLTISGMVPVVGGILSDASEAVLVGAGTVKNAAGIYGLLVMICVFVGPFLKIGVHYLLLKLTAAVCGVFADKKTSDLIADFSSAMGFLLAMTGSVCLLLSISVVCFMKGVG